MIAQGSRTFLQSLSFIESGIVPDFPFVDKHMYVFTREPMQTDRRDVTFVHSIPEFLELIGQDARIKCVWLMGGAELIASFKDQDLIDECIFTVYQKIFMQDWHGIVEKRYVRV